MTDATKRYDTIRARELAARNVAPPRLRHAGRLHRLVLSGCGAAPARVAFDPIRAWNWVKANDKSGEVFAFQQFTWLFSTTFLRNEGGAADHQYVDEQPQSRRA